MEALLVNAAEQLTAIMMELVAEHEQLLHLGQQKKDLLVRNEIQKLRQLVEKEMERVRQVERLELRRQRAVQRLLGEAGADAGIQAVLAVLPQPEREKLTVVAERLRSLLEQLQQLNEQNRMLVEQGLAFVRASMELFAAAEQTGTLYNREAKMDEPPSGTGLSWLDQKV
nr:hypothetical protein [Bacillota bacterium]